jgi:hypothetical protein
MANPLPWIRLPKSEKVRMETLNRSLIKFGHFAIWPFVSRGKRFNT